ncbi:MAG TPA: DUF58 domain-containing protein [Kofleriaceae bacterium]|nr:DUF58 domain-containing protein [Kofleriaceae bacterium]
MRIDRSIFVGLDQLRLAAPMPTTGGRPGDRRSKARGRGVELADFRPYTPGDDLRLVDWNVFARLEQVLVRLFHEDRDLSLLVVVDASASMAFGTPRKVDHAGELAACLAFLALRQRDRVRVVVAARRGGGAASAKGEHTGALPAIVACLERAEPDGVAELAATLGAEAERGRVDQAVVLTDLLVEEEERQTILRRLARIANRPVLLHVLGDGELAPDLSDGSVAIDAETGEELPMKGGRAAAKTYAAELERWRASIETSCRELGILYAPAFTSVPARLLVGDDLRRRQLVQAARGGGR